MKIRFYIDSRTNQPHIYNHNVSEEEVKEVLTYSGEDRLGKGGSRVAIGQTQFGRYLKVIYILEQDGIFIITAYELKGKPLTAYKRRIRR